MVKIFIESYGCTLNNADSDFMISILEKNKHNIIKSEKNADLVIINTCAVKDATEKKEILQIQKIIKMKKPLIIAGCMNYNKKLLKKIAPNAVLLGPYSKSKINNAVDSALKNQRVDYSERLVDEKQKEPVINGVISRISISQGCTEHCSYCATKLARPFLQSSKPREILSNVDYAVQKGAMEIQLTSMDTGAYGLDIKTNLMELLNLIGKNMELKNSNALIRVGMLNPVHIKKIGLELFNCFLQKNFYKFFHIPVQSGSNDVLKIMKRNYEIEDFFEFKKYIEKNFKEFSISTDIIIGHPEETERDFEETLSFMKKAKLGMMNISKFSSRPFTASSRMKQVESSKIKERTFIAYELYKKISLKKNREAVGKTFNVLFTETKNELSRGKTIAYEQVSINKKIIPGTIAKVRIKDATHTTLIGEAEHG